MNLVKNQEFIGQLGENQSINIFRNGLSFFYFSPLMGKHRKYWYVINFFMNL